MIELQDITKTVDGSRSARSAPWAVATLDAGVPTVTRHDELAAVHDVADRQVEQRDRLITCDHRPGARAPHAPRSSRLRAA